MKLSNSIVIIASCIISGTTAFQAASSSSSNIVGLKQQKLLSSSLEAKKDDNSNKKNGVVEDDRRSFMEKMLVTSAFAVAATATPTIANAATAQDKFRSPEQQARALAIAEGNEARREAARMQNAQYRKQKEGVLREAEEIKKAAEKERLAEEKRILAIKEKSPPEKPRVLVIGGTGGFGKEVKAKLEAEGVFVIATSRTGRDGSIELDVTKNYGTIPAVVGKIAKENFCSAVVSCVPPGIGTDDVSLLAGSPGQLACGATMAKTVRNFVAITPSPTIKETPPVGLEKYVKANAIAEGIIKSEFGSGKDGFAYTFLSPGAIGTSKNYGKDKPVPSNILAEAVTVAATAFYLGPLSSLEADSAEKITELAKSVGKVKNIKPYVVPV